MNTTKSQTFVKGAVALALAGMISKILGVVYVVPLQNMIGSYGMGLYQIAYNLYIIALYLALAGFPLALSKAIAERTVENDYDGAEQIFKLSMRLMLATGVTAFVILFFGAPWLAALAGESQATLAIRALAFAILVVPILAAYRGYLQGYQNMAPSGMSQVIEQFVRVAVILTGTYLVLKLGYDVSYGAATATFGGMVGAVASLLMVMYFVAKMRRGFQNRRTGRTSPDSWPMLRKLIAYAIPISLGTLVLPIAQLVDTYTVINLLKWIGVAQKEATESFGILTNDGYRLIQLPVTVATAIGTSLLPAITEAVSSKNETLMKERIDISFRLISLTILPATAVLFVLAEPIDMMLFRHTDGANVMRIVSFMGILMSFEILTTYMLQGIGYMYLPVRNMLIGTGSKFALNLALIPVLGIEGAAVSASLAYLFSSWLNIRSVFKLTGVRLKLGMMLTRPLAASIVMGFMLWGSHRVLLGLFEDVIESARLLATVELMIILPLGGIFYGILTLVMGSITRRELSFIPKIGPKLNRLIERYPWLMRQ
ncbi:putative polysaccharide biosynthesis protein [Effusibacillus consociatus]|uniref:Oligosaccharide flippase family protein n=1 Tax=Effusibacillus consociatus TaxID=1117041 RepID=A0ABV9Q810_9BACL